MKKLLLTLSAFVGLMANATTYYISTTGNDNTGNGTLANPWATLYKSTSVVNTVGDIIHVNAGTYTETQTSLLAVGVSIEGDGSNLSIIKSTLSAQWVSIITLSSQEGTNGNQHISNIKLDGDNLTTSWGINVNGRSNVSIYNCTIVDFMESGVLFSGMVNYAPGPPNIYATGNSFHDNVITNCATADALYGRGGFQFGAQDGMLIYNNTMTETGRAVGTQGWPIKNCNEGYTKNCKIYNNFIKRDPFPYVANGTNNYWDFAVELFDESGMEIYGNEIHGALDMNRQYKGNSPYSVWIHDNIIGFPTFQTHRESGIILEYSTEDAIIENNVVRNVADGIVFSFRSGSEINNTTIRKNLIYNIGCMAGGYGTGIGHFAPGANSYSISAFNIYNNTVVTHSNSAYAPFYGINFTEADTIINWNVKNNIVQGFLDGVLIVNPTSKMNNSSFQYNVFYQNAHSDQPFTTWQGTQPLPGSNVQSNNLLGTNPLFASGNTHSLQATSTLIDAGVNVGLAFNGSAPDIGYWEYQSVATTINDFEKNSVSVYPNPTSNLVTINLNTTQATSIELVDVLGKLVMTKHGNDKLITISLDNLLKGIYMLKINTENNTITKKIIKE